MSNEVQLTDEDVISMGSGRICDNPTCKVIEFRGDLAALLATKVKDYAHAWVGNGNRCEVLKASGGGWQKGTLRLRLEFVPDEPAVPEIPEGHERLLQ